MSGGPVEQPEAIEQEEQGDPPVLITQIQHSVNLAMLADRQERTVALLRAELAGVKAENAELKAKCAQQLEQLKELARARGVPLGEAGGPVTPKKG